MDIKKTVFAHFIWYVTEKHTDGGQENIIYTQHRTIFVSLLLQTVN